MKGLERGTRFVRLLRLFFSGKTARHVLFSWDARTMVDEMEPYL